MIRLIIISILCCFVVACGSGDTKLKIFVTSSKHNGDFENDITLEGNNWVEKADSFCNIDENKKDGYNYKALLVDGLIRNAVSLTNWVLQPNTTYYRLDGNTKIGVTDSRAILNPTIPIDCDDWFSCTDRNVWTGIEDAYNFSTANNCNSWSSSDFDFDWSRAGNRAMTGQYAFTHPTAQHPCGNNYLIYCVQQP